MRRSQVVVLGLLVAGVAVGVTWWALSGREAEAPDAATAEPVAEEMDPHRRRQKEHDEPWPFSAFQADFAALRVEPTSDAASPVGYDQMRQHELKLHKTNMTVSFRDATPEEVIRTFREQLKDTGVKVIDYPEYKHEYEQLRFTFELNEVPVFTVIDYLRAQTEDQFKYYVTSEGLCLGGTSSVQQCQLDANASSQGARQREDSRHKMLLIEYRPDFADATVGAIARQIKDQTGIEVVVEHPVWVNGRHMTWRGKPMPLRDALGQICEKMRCVYRVRGDRVFLIAPTQ